MNTAPTAHQKTQLADSGVLVKGAVGAVDSDAVGSNELSESGANTNVGNWQLSITAEREADQFYTKPKVARWCMNMLEQYLTEHLIVDNVYVEPSAGTGAFYNLLPANKLGFDIDPKAEGICKGNFLEQDLGISGAITVGNPPFGKNSSLAIKFFNHAAKFSQVIAMIFPRTFMKNSVQHRLDKNFHLEVERLLEPNSFVFTGQDYSVPCVFQIWVRKSVIRTSILTELKSTDFRFVNRATGKFAIQRVGVNAGRVKDMADAGATASHYFIDAPDEVRKVFEQMWQQNAYRLVKHNTAGNPSISKRELIVAYREFQGNAQ